MLRKSKSRKKSKGCAFLGALGGATRVASVWVVVERLLGIVGASARLEVRALEDLIAKQFLLFGYQVLREVGVAGQASVGRVLDVLVRIA
jgi:hypothetical protein